MKKCISYVSCSKYNFKDLITEFEANYKLSKYKNFCILEYGEGVSIVFDYGVIVNWNLSYDESKKILSEVSAFEIGKLEKNAYEEFSYETGKQETLKISHDCIYLSSDTIEEKIGISHALAQSIKLTSFENATEDTIETTKNIPIDLATKGKIGLKGKALDKLRGELFLAKSRINLHYDLLDTPEFFWEYTELQHYYTMVANYLEIQNRIQVLNKKLEVIHEIFDMLAEEQKHRHSSILEWIIIWLICVEVFFTITHDIMNLY